MVKKFGRGSLVLSPHLILFSQVLRWGNSGGGGGEVRFWQSREGDA